MPAKSEKQRKLFGAVVGCKKTGKCSPRIKKIAKGISMEDAKDFARKHNKKHLKEEYTFASFLKRKESNEM